ncbi:Mitogen-activated protein kinase kinase kinase 2 [Morus notabilis]|uniref:Mitogen-activated protein kinase kinase kinase 2 n=1 Tax=Morus notabilis TaxID=981085 RepID=W9RY49_9ROSA|nr:mitogen-activated protein kinase kinase kinase 18 [Morus notabilis]EXB77056.1 Mitogen-activated protein kinase kinase kinase 2 [Morus notabilis]
MDWTRGRTIGRGSSAAVSVATARGSGEIFAVKSIQLSRSETLQREQKILSSLNCPHIIGYRGFGVSSENGELLYNLFMEFAPGGSLSDQIRRSGGSLNDAVIRSCTKEILLGLEYLHSVGIAHCDVKARNVLVTGEGLKIADLGCAKLAGDVAIGGTPVYMAPEVARGEQQGFAADVWALGCTVIEMATGRAPWAGCDVNPVSALFKIGFSGDGPEIPSFVSKQGRDFLGKCLKRDPSERWSASELLKHPFLESSRDFVAKEVGFGSSGLDSPRSVLDSGFLDSMEHGKSGHESSSPTNSPAERIRRLSGDSTTSSPLGFGDWASDEDWVTVRDHWAPEEQHGLTCGLEKTNMTLIDTYWTCCGDDSRLATKWNKNCKDSRSNTNSSGGISSKNDSVRDWKRGPLMPSKLCTKDVLCDYLDFGNKDLLFLPRFWKQVFTIFHA